MGAVWPAGPIRRRNSRNSDISSQWPYIFSLYKSLGLPHLEAEDEHTLKTDSRIRPVLCICACTHTIRKDGRPARRIDKVAGYCWPQKF